MSQPRLFAWPMKRPRIPMRIIAPLLCALMLVGPLHTITTPLAVQEATAQTGDSCFPYPVPVPDRVVQNCILRDLGFGELEKQVIDDLMDAHALPRGGGFAGVEPEALKLIAWEPDAIRAAMFASIVAMIQKAPAERSATEQAIVQKMTELVHARRIAAAQFSVDQYALWSIGPCDYVAPPGFEYVIPGSCFVPVGGVFSPPGPPSLEEFIAYGQAHIYADFMEGGIAQAALADGARMVGLVGGLVLATAAAAVGAIVGANLTVVSTVIAAIHPFLAASVAGANSAQAIAAVAGVSAGGVGAASLAALVGIVVAALVIAIIQFITVFEDEAIPGQLQDNLNTTINTPVDLSQLVTNNDGLTELFTTFLQITMPDFAPPSVAPELGPNFLVAPEGGTPTNSPAIRYVCWNPVDCGTEALQSARLTGSWFAASTANPLATTRPERLALGIDYINWEGEGWTAWRIGPAEFLHTRTGDESEPFVSDEIRYMDFDITTGVESKMFARVNKPPTAPGVPVTTSLINQGVFTVSWTGSTDPDGDPVTYTLERLMPPDCVLCGDQFEVIASGLTTTSYAFTDSAPQAPGFWRYRVRAADGSSSTPSPGYSAEIMVETYPPTVLRVNRTAANAHGWNNTDVTVSWTCLDSNMEIPPPQPTGLINVPYDPLGQPVSGAPQENFSFTVSGEGANQSVTDVCWDRAGNTTAQSVSGINIDKTAPTPVHGGPYTAAEGTTITLDGTASSDGLSGVASIAWAVDQDDMFDDGDVATFTPLQGPATYDVKLRVEDKAGNVTIVTTQVHATNALPIVSNPEAHPGPSIEGGEVTASAAFSDSGLNDTHACEIDWGDGSAPTAGTIQDMACTGTHTYRDDDPSATAADEYTITFTVTDDGGGSAEASVVHTVNNAAPMIGAMSSSDNPNAASSPSSEREPMTASAAFTDAGIDDTHTCEIDWGDGSAPTAGTVADMVCSGAHTYLDDDPSGTDADEYTITFTVTDDDGGSIEGSMAHTVHNVAPKIIQITSNEPVPQGKPAIIDVEASDVAGALDPLTYAFDCDNDEMYETIGSVEVHQTLALCANRYTGELGMPASNGSCPSGSIVLTLPAPSATTLCISAYTGAITWSSRGACGVGGRVHLVPDDGPLHYCRSLYTGKLRYSATGVCSTPERAGVIPG